MRRRLLVVGRWPCRCEPIISTRWALHGPSCDRPLHRRRPIRVVRPSDTTSTGQPALTMPLTVVREDETHATECLARRP
jgi:hypothetical protein